MSASEAIENYLEAVLVLSREKDGVHAIDMAIHLGYSRPTVSIMLKQMREKGYVTVNGDNHIELTDTGREIAERIYERHRLLSRLLMELGVSEQVALRDACKIEHDLSDETFEAIKRYTHYKD